jgi:hypothetical protein
MGVTMQTVRILSLFAVLLGGSCSVAIAQDNAAVEQKLTSKYALTKTTADRTDIVKAGAILILKKDLYKTRIRTERSPRMR